MQVLRFLDANKSTYCTPFAKLCKEVFSARQEANDNVKYLNTLHDWFGQLNAIDEFPNLMALFKPIMPVPPICCRAYFNRKSFTVPLSVCLTRVAQYCQAYYFDDMEEFQALQQPGTFSCAYA